MSVSQDNDILKHLSAKEFLGMGMNQIAYIRPVSGQDHESFSIHAADGTQISILSSYNEAVMAARVQHDLYPVTLH